MEVKFFFDKAAVERRGCRLEDVHRTVKGLFAASGFPCVSDGDPLSFMDKGHGDDFACMWDIILPLLHSDWFMDCASVCLWQDENGEEDILAQAGKVYRSEAPPPKDAPQEHQGRGQGVHTDTLLPPISRH